MDFVAWVQLLTVHNVEDFNSGESKISAYVFLGPFIEP